MNLRVEDHSDPVAELERLLRLQDAYKHATQGDGAMERSEVDAAVSLFAGVFAAESAWRELTRRIHDAESNYRC